MEVNPDNKKAVIYCRVSTKEQAEEGNSLVTQEKNCREYALKNGYEIAGVFIEEGESAKTADRPELQKLLSFCANRKNSIQAVIAYKIDRISRNTDDYSQLRILLKRYGVEIKSTSEYFENTPAGRFMENIIANVAQFDNDVRTERSVGGMKDAVREGRYVWKAPIGYVNQKLNGKANIAPSDKARLVKEAFEQVASNSCTLDTVRRELASSGLRGNNGKLLSRSYFYKMVRNPLYAGWIHKFGECHRGSFTPVVSIDLFNAVQRALKRKGPKRSYTLQHPDFILRRFIQHPNGEKLTGSWSQGKYNKYAYYRFQGARLQWTKPLLEKQFLKFVNTFACAPITYEKLKKYVHEVLTSHSNRIQERVTELLGMQKALKEKQNALVQKNISGVISDTVAKEQLATIEDHLWKVSQSLEIREKRTLNFQRVVEDLKEFFMNPAAFWAKLPFSVQSKLLWFEFPKGIIFDGRKFRTPEICSLFKLKEFFLAKLSPNVHHLRLNYEHSILTKFPAPETIASELKALEVILCPS